VGTTVGFWDNIVEAPAPLISPLNPMKVPIGAYEQLFHLLLRGCSFYFLLNRRLRGYYRGKIPQYHRSPITAQNFGYDQFPPVANGWGTIYPIPNKAPTTPG
jgi:hypothetical protein